MRTLSTILLTLALLVSIPAIAAPTGLHCELAEENTGNRRAPFFALIDVEEEEIFVLRYYGLGEWQDEAIRVSLDTISWYMSISPLVSMSLDRKTLVLTSRNGRNITVVRKCNVISAQELQDRAAEYLQQRQQGNRI